jgi:hypothetical protein
MKAYWGVEVKLDLFFNLSTRWSILTIITELNKYRSPLFCKTLKSPLISSFLNQNIFLNTSFSNTCNLCYSLKLRDHISQPHKTLGKTVLYILTFSVLESTHGCYYLLTSVLNICFILPHLNVFLKG